MNQAPTSALVERAARGDRAAFEALVALHGRTMLAVARAHTHGPHDAEEVFQEGALRGWKNIKNLENGDRFVPWICSIIQNAARDGARRARIRSAEEISESASRDITAGDRRRQAVSSAIANLPAPLREVIELFYFGGHTYEEIAIIIGKSAPTVNLRLADAREQLRRHLKDATDIP